MTLPGAVQRPVERRATFLRSVVANDDSLARHGDLQHSMGPGGSDSTMLPKGRWRQGRRSPSLPTLGACPMGLPPVAQLDRAADF